MTSVRLESFDTIYVASSEFAAVQKAVEPHNWLVALAKRPQIDVVEVPILLPGKVLLMDRGSLRREAEALLREPMPLLEFEYGRTETELTFKVKLADCFRSSYRPASMLYIDTLEPTADERAESERRARKHKRRSCKARTDLRRARQRTKGAK